MKNAVLIPGDDVMNSASAQKGRQPKTALHKSKLPRQAPELTNIVKTAIPNHRRLGAGRSCARGAIHRRE